MHSSSPNFFFQSTSATPAVPASISRSDVTWDRPVFKAPPLDVAPPMFDARVVAEELRRGIHQDR